MNYLEGKVSLPRFVVSKIILEHKSSSPAIGTYLLLFNVSLPEFDTQ
jgi:hypothetical protein